MARVHLTFDNGPHPDGTPAVLDVLRAHGVSATFFVLGKHLATPWGSDLARRARDEGHRLGNHSYTHETPLGDDPRPDAVYQELQRTQDLLDPLWTGPRWFRPFGGGGHLGAHLLSPDAVRWMQAHGCTCVLWTSVPGDWVEPVTWVDAALIDAADQDHDVVVLHDIITEAIPQLDGFLRRLRDAGHTFTETFPASCLPIIDGRPQPDLDRFVRQPGDTL